MPALFRRIDGTIGSVIIPTIGLTVGTMGSWTLTRREDAPPEAGEWDLRAVFSYLNEFAWTSTDWPKEIHLTIGPPRTGQVFRLIPADNGRTVLDGKSLLIEGASLVNLEAH